MANWNHINHNSVNSKKEGVADSSGTSRLSFRKLAADNENKTVASGRVVSKENNSEKSSKELYEKAADYLSQVFKAVRQQENFSLNPGIRVIREIIQVETSQDPLFIKALHFDNPVKFIIYHNVNVAIYAINIAKNLDFSRQRLVEIGLAALLHDVGMGLIPEKLLFKQQKLSELELNIFRERSNYAYKILQAFEKSHPYIAECALQVNERLDGSGYPRGLKGDEIHEYAQIIGLVDMYEALVHSRPQRERFHHFSAVKEIIKTGKNLFQRRHLKALLNIFSIFPMHSYVKLNSNAVGQVIETYQNQPLRPKIRIVYDSQQRRVLTERIINLPDNPLLYLVDSVSEEQLQEMSPKDAYKATSSGDEDPEEDITPLEEIGEAIDNGNDSSSQDMEHDLKKGWADRFKWFKFFLTLASVIFLEALIFQQFGTRCAEPVTRNGNKVYKIIEPLNDKGSEAPSLPSQRKIHQGFVQASLQIQKPLNYRRSNPEWMKTNDGETVTIKNQPGCFQADFVSSEDPFNNGRYQTNTGERLRITSVSASEELEKFGPDFQEAPQSYPYSIKLTYFRTREEAERSLPIYWGKNLSPYWVKVHLGRQGTWFRVFAGHFENIEQAEQIIKAHKLKGALVKKTRYATLIGQYSSETALNAQIRLLLQLGFYPYVIQGNEDISLLYVGAFYTRKGAEDQHRELTACNIQSRVVER